MSNPRRRKPHDVALYCTTCGEMQSPEDPPLTKDAVCPHCKTSKEFTTLVPPPKWKGELTPEDRRFLRSVRISWKKETA